MLSQFGPSTIIAVILGVLLAVGAFVPVAAYRYRKTGRLRLIDVAVLLVVAMYAIALWSYTLVPLPEGEPAVCAGRQLVPFQFLSDIRSDGGLSLHNRALLQAVFNVILFMPLGFFIRMLLKRGVVVATLVGFVVSSLIETTQLTGLWGIYRCAYRVFDVDDLMLNTSGALIGSVLAWPVARLVMTRRPAPVVDRITFGRRLVGVLADVLVVAVTGAFAVIVWRAFALYVLDWPIERLPQIVDQGLSLLPPLLIEGYWVFVHGRTIGEAVVQLQPVVETGSRTLRRAVKFVAGVGGYTVLSSAFVSVSWPLSLFVLVSLVVAVRSRDHRGLSHALAGMELRVGDAASGSPDQLHTTSA